MGTCFVHRTLGAMTLNVSVIVACLTIAPDSRAGPVFCPSLTTQDCVPVPGAKAPDFFERELDKILEKYSGAAGRELGRAITGKTGGEVGNALEKIGRAVGSYFGLGDLGAAIGGFFGTFFGPPPSVGPNGASVLRWSEQGRSLLANENTVDNGMSIEVPRSLGREVANAFNSLLAATGSSVVGPLPPVTIGAFRGAYYVCTGSVPPGHCGTTYGDAGAAINAAVTLLLNHATLQGDLFLTTALKANTSSVSDVINAVNLAVENEAIQIMAEIVRKETELNIYQASEMAAANLPQGVSAESHLARAVSEPDPIALLAVGIIGMALFGWRRAVA